MPHRTRPSWIKVFPIKGQDAMRSNGKTRQIGIGGNEKNWNWGLREKWKDFQVMRTK